MCDQQDFFAAVLFQDLCDVINAAVDELKTNGPPKSIDEDLDTVEESEVETTS